MRPSSSERSFPINDASFIQEPAFPAIHPVPGSKVWIEGAEGTFDPLLKKLAELASLPAGWDYGDGIPTRREVTRTAIGLYRHMAKSGLKVDAFPWPNGSVSLVFYRGDMCVEVNIFTQDTYDVVVEKGYGFEYDVMSEISDASLDDVEQAIATIMEPQWYSPGSSIGAFTIIGLGDSGRVVSQIPATNQEFPSLTWNASGSKEDFHVTTSPSIMPEWPETLSSIGMYPSIYPSMQES